MWLSQETVQAGLDTQYAKDWSAVMGADEAAGTAEDAIAQYLDTDRGRTDIVLSRVKAVVPKAAFTDIEGYEYCLSLIHYAF